MKNWHEILDQYSWPRSGHLCTKLLYIATIAFVRHCIDKKNKSNSLQSRDHLVFDVVAWECGHLIIRLFNRPTLEPAVCIVLRILFEEQTECSTLIPLLRIPSLGRIGSTKLVLPKWQNQSLIYRKVGSSSWRDTI